MNALRAVLLLVLLVATSMAVCAAGRQSGETMYTVDEARAILDYNQKKNPDQDWSLQTFARHRLSVSAEQLQSNDRFDKELLDTDVPPIPTIEPKAGMHFLGIKIRSSFSDVLSSEDPTVQGDQPATAKDLKGAAFSYQHDSKISKDIWIAKGALLFPFTGATTFAPHLGDPPGLHTYGFIPSVSFHRETHDEDGSKNIDSLIFRGGLFAKYTSGIWLRAQTIRVFATYGTDFNFKSSTPAAEFEYEPVIFFKDSRFGIGSTYSLHEVSDPESPTGTRTNLAYLLRAYLHGEYGETTDPGDKIGVSTETFFRVGPRFELRLDPLFTDHFAVGFAYQQFHSITGTSAHRRHLLMEAEYRFTTERDQEKNPSIPIISLKATYERGGIDLTKEDVRTFFVGLGVTL
jgi:hypothetical protein